MNDAEEKGIVFNIQSYSVHDGPGIRTIVFLKGCPLKCRWCSNPESQFHEAEICWNASLCIGCRSCVDACPKKALSLSEHGIIRHQEKCIKCHACITACPAKAMFAYGEEKTVQQVLDEVEKDSLFYARSSGGITLSGGEALAQPRFALALLKEARARHMNCAMETSAFCSEETMLKAASLLHYLFIDIKLLDSERHRIFTGVPNERILSNIRSVRTVFPMLKVHLRTPVIPGVNDTEDDIRSIASLARSLGVHSYELLAYHKMGESKYRFLNREYLMGDIQLEETKFKMLKAVAEEVMSSAF